MDKFNDVEYKSIPKDEECMVTAVKIGEILNEPASRIRKWAEYHEDNLYIKKVNGRFVYTQKSIKQFEFIKDLKQNKGMTHEQIKQYMKKHGIECEKFSSGIINPNDPFGYEVLSSAIAQETENKLKEFMGMFIQYQEKNNIELVNLIKSDIEQIEQSVDDRLKLSEEKITNQTEKIQENIKTNNQELLKEINEQKEQNKKLLEYVDSIQKEVAITREMNEKMDFMKNAMEERKKENQLEISSEKQSFWSKFFKK